MKNPRSQLKIFTSKYESLEKSCAEVESKCAEFLAENGGSITHADLQIREGASAFRCVLIVTIEHPLYLIETGETRVIEDTSEYEVSRIARAVRSGYGS